METCRNYAEALAGFKTKTAAIRYAVTELAGAPTAEVIAWLAGYGYTVSRSKVYPEVRAYRNAHGLTDNPTTQPTVPAVPLSQPETAQTVPTVPTELPRLPDSGTPADGDTPTAPVPLSPPDTGETWETVPTVPTNAPNVPVVPVVPTGQPGQLPVEQVPPTSREERAPWVAVACYTVAAVSLAVSLNRHAQQFLSAFSGISPHFKPRRHLLSAAQWRTEMAERFTVWNEITAPATAA